MAVIQVRSHPRPPVRYHGRTWIRIGQRLVPATPDDEHALVEKRYRNALLWDEWLSAGAEISDLRMDYIRQDYVPRRIVVENPADLDSRSDIDILSTLRLWYRGIEKHGPNHAAMLLFSHRPRDFYRGLWLQFVRFEGDSRSSTVLDDQEYSGDVFEQLRSLEQIDRHLRTVTLPDGREVPEYPAQAIREALINAIMHRDYAQESPIQFNWFSDRIEILNAGGLMPGVDPEVFSRNKPPPGWSGRRTAYRNEVISEAMKTYVYVQKLGTGIPKIRDSLAANGNPHAFFIWSQITFQATLYSVTQPRFDTDEEEIAWLMQKEGNEKVGPLLQRLEFRVVEMKQLAKQRKQDPIEARRKAAIEREGRLLKQQERKAAEARAEDERRQREAAEAEARTRAEQAESSRGQGYASEPLRNSAHTRYRHPGTHTRAN